MRTTLSIQFLAICLLVCFTACNSGKKDNAFADAEIVEPQMPGDEEEAAGPDFTQLAAAWHGVEDYAAWKTVYDAADSTIESNGMIKMVIGRADDDSNYVLTAHGVYDMEQAMAMANSEEIKNTMAEAGVNTDVEFDFMDILDMRIPSGDNPRRFLVSHKANDWDQFKAVYDSVTNVPEGEDYHGMTPVFLGRGVEDPNRSYVVFVVNDEEKVRAWRASDELKAIKEEAGIIEGESRSRFFTIAEWNEK